jgi:hypothetical protein
MSPYVPSPVLRVTEQEFVKQPFDLIKSSLMQYADVSTFFGYTIFFTSALPVAPFFALINTYLGTNGQCILSSQDSDLVHYFISDLRTNVMNRTELYWIVDLSHIPSDSNSSPPSNPSRYSLQRLLHAQSISPPSAYWRSGHR